MFPTRNYVYAILVKGQKRVGGTIHADSMDDAVRRIMKRDNLSIFCPESTERFVSTTWVYKGEKASVLVWAPPEYFGTPRAAC